MSFYSLSLTGLRLPGGVLDFARAAAAQASAGRGGAAIMCF